MQQVNLARPQLRASFDPSFPSVSVRFCVATTPASILPWWQVMIILILYGLAIFARVFPYLFSRFSFPFRINSWRFTAV